MPPTKKDEGEGIVFFHPNATNGRQLGSMAEALMCSAIDDAKKLYNIDGTETDLENLLNKEEAKAQVMSGDIKPLGIEHIYDLFPRDKK